MGQTLTDNTLTTITLDIEPIDVACTLTLTHDGLDPASPLTASGTAGWAQVLSGLKTLLETGEPLVVGV